MIRGVLTADNPESEVFEFSGECCICLKGAGSASIMRYMGAGFEVMTTDHGEPLSFTPGTDSGVMFNGAIRCNKRLKYKIVGLPAGSVEYFVIPEEK